MLTVGATHLVGGEITYEHLGNNNYEITLHVYRDCGVANVNQTQFDAVASVGIFLTANGAYYTELAIPLESSNVSTVPLALENPCFVLPPDVCVEEALYQITVNLPASAGGYTLTYQRCCRNPSIVNIISPQDSGATFTTLIPGTAIAPANNSGAVFNNFPPPALCQNAEFFFDHSATDPDGDELVYEFCTPLDGGSPFNPQPIPPDPPPYNEINWANGFSTLDPIISAPQFVIDQNTGLITGTATQMGQYVLGVCVSEFRNGVLINYTNRDFQFNVTLCDPTIIADFPTPEAGIEIGESACLGLTHTFENLSINATIFYWDFGVPNIDSDTSNLEFPTFVFPAEGEYLVSLIANPGWTCADTAYQMCSFFEPLSATIALFDFECSNNQGLYDFQSIVEGDISELNYDWSFGLSSFPTTSGQDNPENVRLNPEAGSQLVSLTVSDNSCEAYAEITVPIVPEPVASIVPQEVFCDGLTYTFQNASIQAETYRWDFNTSLNGDNSNLLNPTFTFPDTGLYVIQLVAMAEGACSDTTTIDFTIYGLLDPFFDEHEPQCLSDNSFNFVAEGASSDEAVYLWNFDEGAAPPTSAAALANNISYNTPGWKNVTLTIAENGCLETYTDSLWVVIDPVMNFSAVNNIGCPPLYVTFQSEVTAETDVAYFWDFGNGVNSTATNPIAIYPNAGVYDVTLIASTSNGCVRNLTLTLNDTVLVNPVPIPGFVITPTSVNILNPYIEVADSSQFGTSCMYFLSDGTTYEDCNFSHSFSTAGEQRITQVVSNEYGCTASVIGYVDVGGLLFYAPNAFTPDGDGTNDVWLPVATGIKEYDLDIFDRWGTVIFSTADAKEPWLGQIRGGNHFATNGVYYYQVKLRDLVDESYTFDGYITIVR